MKDYKFNFKVNEKEYSMIFNLNSMQDIQKKYGSLKQWGELTDGSKGEVDIEALVFGFTSMLNEAIDINNDERGSNEPLLTQKQVARLISKVGVDKAAQQMNQTVIEGTKSDTPKNG